MRPSVRQNKYRNHAVLFITQMWKAIDKNIVNSISGSILVFIKAEKTRLYIDIQFNKIFLRKMIEIVDSYD